MVPVASSEHRKGVILSEAPPRIYRITDGLWREVEEPLPSAVEGTPTMRAGRCSWKLSEHKRFKKS